MGRSIDQILDHARSQLNRVDPDDAHRRIEGGALLVDIRPHAQRLREGEIPEAVIIERNVLEWRLDPQSESRLPNADSYDLTVIVFCSEGYTSSLAASALKELGHTHATDMIGGFNAWKQAGFPIRPGGSKAIHEPGH